MRGPPRTDSFDIDVKELQRLSQKLHDKGQVLRTRRTVVPIPATIQVLSASDQRVRIRHCDSAADAILDLLHSKSSGAHRIRVEGSPGSGKESQCEVVAYRLAESYVNERGTSYSETPFPVLAQWGEWINRCNEELPGAGDREYAAALFSAAGVLGSSLGDPLSAIEDTRVALIIVGFDARHETSSASSFLGAIRVLRRSARLVVAGPEYSEISIAAHTRRAEPDLGGFTHCVRLTTPLDVRRVAAACRRELRERLPGASDFVTLGDEIPAFASPAVAGIALARVKAGQIEPRALLSETHMLASIYSLDLADRLGISPTPDMNGPDREPNDGLLDLFLVLRQRAKADENVIRQITADATPAGRTTSLLQEQRGNKWIDPGFEGARRFVLRLVRRRLEPEDVAPTSETIVFGEPGEQVAVEYPQILGVIDWLGVRILCEQTKQESPDIVATLQNRCAEFIDRMIELFERADLRWGHLRNVWRPFTAALGVVGRSAESDQKSSARRDSVVESLGQQFSREREDHESQGNLRYFGAGAASVVLGPTGIAKKLEELLGHSDRESELERIAQSLTFLAEVSVRLGSGTTLAKGGDSDVYAMSESMWRVLMDERVARITGEPHSSTPRDIGDHHEIRHARYHLLDALARVTPRRYRQVRFLDLWKLYFGAPPLRRSPAREQLTRAIEISRVVRVLWAEGVLLTEHPTSLARSIAMCAIDEVRDREYWGETLVDAPYLWAHAFLACQSLAPLMTKFQRRDVLDYVFDENVASQQGAKPPRFPFVKLDEDTASLLYLLHWLRDETAAGVIPGDRCLEQLHDWRDAIETKRHEDDALNPDAAVLEYLEEIIESCVSSPPQDSP